jgi:hypothetical protein
MTPRVDDGQHPAVRDPRVYLTCACCIRRELLPAIEALRHGRHGKAKLLLMKLCVGLDEQIEAAVSGRSGRIAMIARGTMTHVRPRT